MTDEVLLNLSKML